MSTSQKVLTPYPLKLTNNNTELTSASFFNMVPLICNTLSSAMHRLLYAFAGCLQLYSWIYALPPLDHGHWHDDNLLQQFWGVWRNDSLKGTRSGLDVIWPQSTASAMLQQFEQREGWCHLTKEHLVTVIFVVYSKLAPFTWHEALRWIVHCLMSHPFPDNAQGLFLENPRKESASLFLLLAESWRSFWHICQVLPFHTLVFALQLTRVDPCVVTSNIITLWKWNMWWMIP